MNVKQESEWRKSFVLRAYVHNSKLKNATIEWFSNIGSQLMAYRTAICESLGFHLFMFCLVGLLHCQLIF